MDKKDTQLLNLLGRNARLSNATLAASLQISKDAIAYRIRQLEMNKEILQYMLFIDNRVLGFTRYHLLVRLDAKKIERHAIIEKIRAHPFVMWINTFIGRFDLQIIVDAHDSFHLKKITEELFATANSKIKEYTVLTHLSDFAFTNLNPVIDVGAKVETKNDFSFSDKLLKEDFPVAASFVKYLPKIAEAKVLSILAENPRATLLEISGKAGLDRQTVKKHISELIKRGVIINFGAIPNYSSMGFVVYYMLVRVAQGTSREILSKPFAHLNNIFYAGHMIGDYDMILYLNARNPKELNESIDEFRKHLESHIVHYDLLVQDQVHHWKQFTPGIAKTFL